MMSHTLRQIPVNSLRLAENMETLERALCDWGGVVGLGYCGSKPQKDLNSMSYWISAFFFLFRCGGAAYIYNYNDSQNHNNNNNHCFVSGIHYILCLL